MDTFGFMEDEILEVSAKENVGIDRLMDAIVERIPPPKTTGDKFKL